MSKKGSASRKGSTGSKKANKKTAAGKRSTSSAGRKQTTPNPETAFLTGEVAVLVTITIGILMILSLFGIGGSVGGAAATILRGLFGLMAYVFPVLLVYIVSTMVANDWSARAIRRDGSLLLLFYSFCAFFQLFGSAGGSLGEAAENVFVPTIGFAGALVIHLLLLIIGGVLLTEKSVLNSVQSGGGRAYEKAKERAQKARSDRSARREISLQTLSDETVTDERKNRRRGKDAPRTVSKKHLPGISFETTLMKDPVKDPEVREIAPEPIRKTNLTVTGMIAEEDPALETPAAEKKPEVKKQRKTRDPQSVARETEAICKQAEETITEQTEGVSGESPVYQYPPISLLRKGVGKAGESAASLKETAEKLEMTLRTFGVNAAVTNVSCGPSVTRYELQPEMGVKVSRIVSLADDLKLNLAAADIRIEAPIPGKAAVGIEVPNKENTAVMFRDLIDTPEFETSKSRLSFAVGKDISGKAVISDIAKMPHVLIAGATGSGKSVCINTLIMSILYKAKPDEVKLIMIDPKVVELSVYNGIPHLLIPVVTDPKKAAGALNWAVLEMTRRYEEFKRFGVRNIGGYNEKVKELPEDGDVHVRPMYQLVVIVDELADLMMVASKEVEEAICRLAQLARAAGIHLVVATQRPSVNVITGLIKANMPSRIAFAVTSGIDSRTIIDMNGAEKLLGKGDMLFYPAGYPKPVRVQGSFVSDAEIQKVVTFLREHTEAEGYDEEIANQVNASDVTSVSISETADEGDDRDAYFTEAGRLIVESQKASIGMLQRKFKIGFNRAARVMDQLCEAGVVGGEEGTKPRKILMTPEEFEEYIRH